jgi:DNA-binding beta-propeller fold protein YncE
MALVALPVRAPAVASPDPNMIFWGDNSANTIGEANLDGTGNGHNWNTGAATVGNPYGTAIDPTGNKIFWANDQGGHWKISEASLDDSGVGTDLSTAGATLDIPAGVAVDPATNKIYWANEAGGTGGTGTISFANLDGTGSGGDLKTGSATVNDPQGVAIDPQDNKIFWTNAAPGNKISFASLDNSGTGGDLTLSGTATALNNPVGLAIDPSAGKIYWANTSAGKISEANLDGSQSHDLNPGTATVNVPVGVAIDPAANKIYWANKGNGKISDANLDGTGGGQDLSTAGATSFAPTFPALLEAPLGTGAPNVTGNSTAGSTLSCSQGAWAGDLLGAFLYRAPHTYSYQWTFNGADIAGATSSTYPAPAGGSYACRVTASNEAGSNSQTSEAFAVTGSGTPPPTNPTTASNPPKLSGVGQSHRRWREGSKLPVIASVRAPVGTTFRFTVNESVKVRFAFTQRRHGHRVTRGTLRFSVGAGAHKVRFKGRLSKHKRLKPGRYTLIITATNIAGQRATAKLTFAIVRF